MMKFLDLPGDCIRYIISFLKLNDCHESVYFMRFICKKVYIYLNSVVDNSYKDIANVIGSLGTISIFKEGFLYSVNRKRYIEYVFLGALSNNNLSILELFTVKKDETKIRTFIDCSIELLYNFVYVKYENIECLIHPKLFMEALGKNANEEILNKYYNLCLFEGPIYTYLIEAVCYMDDADKSMKIIEWITKHEDCIFYHKNIEFYYFIINRTGAVNTLKRMLEFDNTYLESYCDWLCFHNDYTVPANCHCNERKQQFYKYIKDTARLYGKKDIQYDQYIRKLAVSGCIIKLKLICNSEEYGKTSAIQILLQEIRNKRLLLSIRYDLYPLYRVDYLIEVMNIMGNDWNISPQDIYKIININDCPVKSVVRLVSFLVKVRKATPKSLQMRHYFTKLSPMKVIEFLIACEEYQLQLCNIELNDNHVILLLNKWGKKYLNPRWPFMISKVLNKLCKVKRENKVWKFYYDRLDKLHINPI